MMFGRRSRRSTEPDRRPRPGPDPDDVYDRLDHLAHDIEEAAHEVLVVAKLLRDERDFPDGES